MNNKGSQKWFVLIFLIIFTIIILIALPLMFLNYGNFGINGKTISASEMSLGMKFFISSLFIFVGVLLWWMYLRQNRIDEKINVEEIDKGMSLVYKVSGYYLIIYTIISFIIGIVLFILGLIIIFFGIGSINAFNRRLILGGIVLFASLIFFIRGGIYWWRSKPLVKGKMY